MDTMETFRSRTKAKVSAQIKLYTTSGWPNIWTADLYTVVNAHIWTLSLAAGDTKQFAFPIDITDPRTVDQEEMREILTQKWLPLGAYWRPDREIVVTKIDRGPVLIPHNDIRLQMLYGEIKGALSIDRESGDHVIKLIFMQRWSGFVSSLGWHIASFGI